MFQTKTTVSGGQGLKHLFAFYLCPPGERESLAEIKISGSKLGDIRGALSHDESGTIKGQGAVWSDDILRPVSL